MNKELESIRRELRFIRNRWGRLSKLELQSVKQLMARHGLSAVAGDAIYLSRVWYVTHAGLLRVARRNRCRGIHVRPVPEFCDPSSSRWAFEATVYNSSACRGFVGYGDADPSNVSSRVRGAEMRVAETRAVNRALRKAYGIGICSAEELSSFSGPSPPAAAQRASFANSERTNGNGQHPLRDRLCLIIRQHQLDPALVKAYAADYCGVSELRQASREQVEEFVSHLAQYAVKDREGLLCQLNSYAAKPVAAEAVAGDAGEEKAAGAA